MQRVRKNENISKHAACEVVRNEKEENCYLIKQVIYMGKCVLKKGICILTGGCYHGIVDL